MAPSTSAEAAPRDPAPRFSDRALRPGTRLEHAREVDTGAAVVLRDLGEVEPAEVDGIRAMASVVQDLQHPCLPAFRGLVSEGGRWLAVWDAVEGERLDVFVRAETDPQPASAEGSSRPGAYSELRVHAVLEQLAPALVDLHATGIAHGALCLEGCVVTPDGRVVLRDAGWFGTRHPSAPESAPELRSGGPDTPQGDWYALGVLLHQLLTGEVPQSGPDSSAPSLQGGPPPPGRLAAVPPELDSLCADLLRWDPAARPQGQDVVSRLRGDWLERTSASSGRMASAEEQGGAQEFTGTSRFELLGELGRGGMGVVYSALDHETQTKVALKTLRQLSAMGLFMFKREFRALADLRHPNLIQMYELICDRGLWFFTMELLDAVDFLRHVRGGPAGAPPLSHGPAARAQDVSTRSLPRAPADPVEGSPDRGTPEAGPQALPVSEAGALDQTHPTPAPPIAGPREDPLAQTHVRAVPVPEVLPEPLPEAVGADALEAGLPPTSPPRSPGPGPGFDEARLREGFLELARGLDALHQRDLVHRDIKPSNVLVADGGRRVVLMDFGLVTKGSLPLGAAGGAAGGDEPAMVGTPLFMAPEQALGRAVGPAADWYAVGAMLYQALTGELPFRGDSLSQVIRAKLEREPPPPQLLVPGIPDDLDDLCVELLRRDPAQRPRGAEILARLGAGAQSAQGSSPPAVQVPFVGRASELAALEAAYGRAVERHPVVALVHGVSGLGKSALIRHFLARVERPEAAHRARVLSGRCYEQESVPYKAFDGVIDALSVELARLEPSALAALLPRDIGLLAQVFPVLRRIAEIDARVVEHADGDDPLARRTRAFGALRELLQGLLAAGPLVLFIDDLQWADKDSLALLLELLRQPAPPGVMVVATVRGQASETLAPQGPLAALSSLTGDVRHLALQPLTGAETLELAGAVGGGAAATAALIEESGGHPLFLLELARHSAQRGTGAGVVARLDELIVDRVRQLPEEAQRVLELVALAGAPLPQSVIAHASKLASWQSARAVEALRRQQLVRTLGLQEQAPIEPYHDRIRESVGARLPTAARVERHLRLAEALEHSGAAESHPQALVRHFAAAGERGRAAHHAERAAVRATQLLAFDNASELYRLALELGSHGPDEQRRLRVALANTLTNAGRGPEAAAAYLAALEGAGDQERLDWHRKAAELQLASGHLEEGLRNFDAVLAEVGARLPRSPGGALLHLLTQRALLKLRGLRYTRRDPAAIPRRELQRIDLFNGILVGLGAVDNVNAFGFQTRALLRALRAGEEHRIGWGFAFEALSQAMLGVGQEQQAFAVIELSKEISRRTADPYLGGVSTICEGMCQHYVGRFGQAARTLAEGEAIFRKQTLATAKELGTTRLMRVQALRLAGEFGEMAPFLTDLVRDAVRRGDRFAEVSLTRAASTLQLIEDRPESALEELERKVWVPPQGRYHMQHWYALRTRAEVALYQGKAGAAAALGDGFEQLRRSKLPRIEVLRLEMWWLRGRLALLRAAEGLDRDGALAEVRAMVKLLRRSKAPYAHAWAGMLEAGLHAQSGEQEQATRLLEQLLPAMESYLELCAAATQQALARRKADDGTRAAKAATYFQRERAVNPDALARMVLPGW